MENDESLADISEGITCISEKLKSLKNITIKTPTSIAAQSYILSKIAQTRDFQESCILVLVKDEYAKLNLYNLIQKWLKESKKHIPIFVDTSTATLSHIYKKKTGIIILTQEENKIPLCSTEYFSKYIIKLKKDNKLSKEKLLQKLVKSGYSPSRTSAAEGLFANRGSVVDVYPNTSAHAIRIDFDDDKIDSIKTFTPGKTKTQEIKTFEIIPHKIEHLPAQSTLLSHNKNIKIIEFESFPSKADVIINISQDKIRALSVAIEPEEKNQTPERKLSFVKHLQDGDFVVHLDHGIACFEGIVEQKIDGIEREYFKLRYAEDDLLFLPVIMAEKMEKYIGGPSPILGRLSGSGWNKALGKAALDTLSQARELLNTQAHRQLASANSINNSKEIKQELSKSFPFTETKDQQNVINDVYEDLEKKTPMDRLVCGDVGFGKTEVAIRAAAVATLSGYQVAVLSPTTILTQQHLDTFKERLKDFPINVVGLSRFQSKTEQKKIVEDLANGKADIVIGTHRLLSEDIKFQNLGLIIVDEEQRFGVAHKEQLKKMRSEAHVITLTATPIPRTLHLALSGVRAVSNISTPPEGRKPIETIIEPHNQKHVQSAIEKEINRKGQIYYLYNNVQTMDIKMQELQELMPKIKFGRLHGQLPENQIADVMHKFDKREIDVLICSTIIENGLDLPNVNTLIVDNAVLFGLSQLHQIRGRIGRGSRQAYAYFFYKRQKLTGEAEKRLEALEQACDLGSGFDIAQRDMEIRGVGNVLGKSQHGHVKSIGLGLYLRFLNKAVEEIKSGEGTQVLADITVDLPIEARIPQFFENKREKRIELYHEWAMIDNLDELQDAKDELYKQGALPQTVENLFYILKLKILGRIAGLESIDTSFESANSQEQAIILKTPNPVEPKQFAKILNICDKAQYSTEEIRIPKRDLGSNWMKNLENCVKLLANN